MPENHQKNNTKSARKGVPQCLMRSNMNAQSRCSGFASRRNTISASTAAPTTDSARWRSCSKNSTTADRTAQGSRRCISIRNPVCRPTAWNVPPPRKTLWPTCSDGAPERRDSTAGSCWGICAMRRTDGTRNPPAIRSCTIRTACGGRCCWRAISTSRPRTNSSKNSCVWGTIRKAARTAI